MVKEKTIDFFTGYNQLNKYSKTTKILIFFLILVLIFKLILGIQSIKKLENYLNNNESKINNEEPVIHKSYIDFNKIKSIYDLIGESNINRFIVKKSVVEIEGICQSLEEINRIKHEKNIKNFSINTLKNNVDNYIFTVDFQMGV
ncbi:hypothetical protein CHF27_003535 [Romboutsia maritimum]|uniref:Uncharacterized protein n=1 Tax=Romboutsia maritimum TaxID=2020948 RepID=A0A371IVC6_9FIRM|nr:hypothetical protein [Romboutsia maritimum]RDY24440.1 hypothetical protein CHF27_003535 [Romboutsia maritimum]